MIKIRQLAMLAGAAVALASCGPQGGLDFSNFDPDLRRWGRGGLETSGAAARAQPRPAPDQRGVISYPGYQVAIARQGDTVATIAARLGLNAAELARYNAIEANTVLNPGAVVALPRRVSAGVPAAAPVVSSTGQVSDPFAGQGVRQPNVPPAAGAAGAVTAQTLPAASQPRQHVVAAGETAWSIARKYNVSVNDLAQWNGLTQQMTLRTGQRLLIPVAGQSRPATAVVTAPGTGSPTPRPPSSAEPLPNERTQPAASAVNKPAGPDLGQTRTAASGSGKFRMPANGAIIRTYQKGKNDGIDISAAPGSTVAAAGSGTVAAITRDTDQVPIIVVRHEGNLMTVYAGLEDVAVTKGQSVSAGTPLGKARSQGVVHFEVRNGFDSVDPEKYLN
ncbi:LysM peptidoglycan-binding domain-containing protein [Paracoccus versutus]|uniref:Murein DD-endopeptidase MepM/ murein hydrolase activator NlpD n=1 Tax=Paracoccus versutus TaxID=34007 RepID=A0A3E0CD80_PARVE|nr:MULTISPECIES: LysM peptidoglycan-binding domain-containing protein [Paracoccus]REF67753.1 murein DD-endopeptidase MepM/ murein hydrolase activator NlpD [Paracoccus versutus]REG55391.1 murein DD-endopeptidase MepM/ murein hydrolase activator NlpD [Paracoccus versutus]WEJ78316.1 LysM peptidoglycan-binding domain-containing protein [Paracoccus versutus]WGR58305.1 LysM peptidoglycan-binding domain-containing protein [Paracoccus versutus]